MGKIKNWTKKTIWNQVKYNPRQIKVTQNLLNNRINLNWEQKILLRFRMKVMKNQKNNHLSNRVKFRKIYWAQN